MAGEVVVVAQVELEVLMQELKRFFELVLAPCPHQNFPLRLLDKNQI